MKSAWALSCLYLTCLILILSRCNGSACAQTELQDGRTISLADATYDRVIVAKVGTVKITAQEFLLSYEFGPAFTKRENNSKLRYLNFMINEKLLALEGYARGLHNTRIAREALAEIEGDLASEELYMQDVASGVTVTDREIAEGIGKKQTSLALRWIFSQTATGIATAQQLLKRGSSFDSVFALQLRDGVRADDRSLQTTSFDLAMENPLLALIVDSLADGEVSLPLHVEDGWYIVQLTGRQTSPVMSQTEDARLHEDVHRALVQRKSDRRSDEYINQIITDAKPEIERRAFDIVQAYLAASIVPHDRFEQWRMTDLLFRKWGPVGFTDIEPFKGETIVTYREGTLTVADFLQWYEARSTGIHLAVSSPQAFFASLEGIVWRMVRDKLLVQRAFKKRLQFRAVVQKQKKWWEEKILYEMEKSLIADSIPMDSLTLRQYFAGHHYEYRDSTGRGGTFENVKEDVERAYYPDALNKRLFYRIQELKAKYNVTIDEAVLDSLPVDSQNQPRTIDVYAVKKGGTFPRPAFPSIDVGWQQWQ